MARFYPLLFAQVICVLAGVAWCAPSAVAADADGDAGLAAARAASTKAYKDRVVPFMTAHCDRCHGVKRQKGGVTFASAMKTPESASFRLLWKRAATQIKSHDMPPESEETQPTDEERLAIADWVDGMKRLSPKDPGAFVIRRLNRFEYGNTLHDLLGVDAGVAHELPDEVFGAGYTNSLSPLLMEQYLSVATDALNQAIAPPGKPPTAAQRDLFGNDPPVGADPKAAARKVAKSLARRAYRRPPSDAEVDLLVRVFSLASDQGRPYGESLRLMTKAVLVSPQFLFITPEVAGRPAEPQTTSTRPAEPIQATGIVALDDFQLASRLSYLLWATTPDAELSALADQGKLRDPDVLAGQARRLLADPRARAFFDGFGAQWLGLDKLAGKSFDPAKFPQMTPDLRSAMYDEARLLFDSVVRENRSLQTFIDGDYTFVNATLAPLYGLEGKVAGPTMQRVTLADANRGGILTMPGVLATSSFPNRTSAVNRGVWVLEQVLGEHVPPPPANVPALDKQDSAKVAEMTLRQRTELHRTNAACASCHKVLDPIGFGLENFDAIGRWRDKDDSGGPIDATGELPGGHKFGTPAELKTIIAKRTDDFSRNLTGRLMAYALCRQLEGYDEVVVDKLSDSVAKDGYGMQTLVVGVVTSYPFMNRKLGTERVDPDAKDSKKPPEADGKPKPTTKPAKNPKDGAKPKGASDEKAKSKVKT